ncbi:MAG: metallophosphoesterase [Nanoarchaeota archaeon]
MEGKIILFTDLHFGSNVENKEGKIGVNTHGGNIQMEIRGLIRKIKQINPVFTVNLGDAIHANSKENALSLFKDIVDLFEGIKVFHLLGNHDTKFLKPEEIEALTHQKSHYSFVTGKVKHIFIDSFKKGEEISLPEDTFKWLKKELNTSKLIVIYSHYPITNDPRNLSYYHIKYPQRSFLIESAQIRMLLEESGNVIMFINGHTHFQFSKNIKGVRHHTIPSFSEDDEGNPSAKFGILDLDRLELEIKTV